MHISDALRDQIHGSKSLLHRVAAMMVDPTLALWSWWPEQLQTSICCRQREDSRVVDQSRLHAHTFPLCVRKYIRYYLQTTSLLTRMVKPVQEQGQSVSFSTQSFTQNVHVFMTSKTQELKSIRGKKPLLLSYWNHNTSRFPAAFKRTCI